MPPPRATKPKRRTKERVLEHALALYNRFGEANVSINAVAADMGISPGNLYYHYPAKDTVTEALVLQHGAHMQALFAAAGDVGDIESAWFFLHTWLERVWSARFLYRDQNNLLIKTRALETAMRELVDGSIDALHAMLRALQAPGWLRTPDADLPRLAQNMALVIHYWLSFAYVRNPRHALEPASEQQAVLQGALNTLSLLLPHLSDPAQRHLQAVMAHYGDTSASD